MVQTSEELLLFRRTLFGEVNYNGNSSITIISSYTLARFIALGATCVNYLYLLYKGGHVFGVIVVVFFRLVSRLSLAERFQQFPVFLTLFQNLRVFIDL